MKNLRFISVQPRMQYYAWQIEVMINNFIKHGINPNSIDILVGYNENPLDLTNSKKNIEIFDKLAQTYNNVRFFFYEDDRKNAKYVSSLRPNILKKHFKLHPELSFEAIFYHDCDIIFTKSIDFSKFLQDDIWYLSDTISYIGSKYILSKGQNVYKDMCDIVGIDQKIPKIMQSNSGGAQYIMKNIDHSFWEKVENDSEKLFSFINSKMSIYENIWKHDLLREGKAVIKEGKLIYKYQQDQPNPPEVFYHPLQIWTADMWAVLWNAWYFEHETKVVPELSFIWATDDISKWDNYSIYHNAGVDGSSMDTNKYFFKAEFQTHYPYYINENNYDKYKCCYNYVNEILETKQKSCLI